MTNCPSCYYAQVWCRKCKTRHCQCSWNKCPNVAASPRRRVTGHALNMDEAAWKTNRDGDHLAQCECGLETPLWGSMREIRNWHRSHKSAVLASRAEAERTKE